MSFDADRLFALLPAIHRLRDAEIALATPLLSGAEQAELAALDGKARNAPPPLTPDEGRRRDALRRKAETGPLKSLLSIVAEQVAGIEENVAQLYDDLFIETCADWVVPYIGDLVGYAAIGKVVGSVASRAEVADTIRFRRAKGTAVSIEGVARDVTGRDATVVEYFRRMAVTQTLNHLRPAVTTASLRKPLDDVDPGGPFDLVARGVDLRPPNLGGRTNIPNLGIFLWNWQGLGLTGVTAARVDAARFLFDPLGQDRPLVVAGVRGTGLSGPGNVVRALSRRDAAAMPAAALAAAFTIRVGGTAVDPATIRICCLADLTADPATSAWASMPPSGIAVDPELGRIAFAQAPADTVTTDHVTAGDGFLGGGAYDREATFTSNAPAVAVPHDAPTLAAALHAGAQDVVEVSVNARMDGAAVPADIDVAAGKVLEIRAAEGIFPVLAPATAIALTGGAGSELVLDGFLITGAGLIVPAQNGGAPNDLSLLRLRHCTLVPGLTLTRAGAAGSPDAPSLVVEAENVRIEIVNCITGPLRINRDSQLRLWSSVVDGGATDSAAISGPTAAVPAGPVWAFNCTVRGVVRTAMAGLISNCIMLGTLLVSQRQSGLVRFSWLPGASRTPRRYDCVSEPVTPAFTSTQLGDAGFFRLAPGADPAVATGADDGGAMGAYHELQDSARRRGLAATLADYIPFGLAAGFFDVSAPSRKRSSPS